MKGEADAGVMANRPSYYCTMKNYRQRMSDQIAANNKNANKGNGPGAPSTPSGDLHPVTTQLGAKIGVNKHHVP